MSSANHDTLVYRLAQILIKLNQGERLDPLSLADEFGVNLRAIAFRAQRAQNPKSNAVRVYCARADRPDEVSFISV